MIEERLHELGLSLPTPHKPVGQYLGAKRSGALLFVSGRVGDLKGAVGADVSTEAARVAAHDTVLQLLAIAKQEIGSLDNIVSIECVRGFIRSAVDFTDQPMVLDGASELLIKLWGDRGRHARTATGVAQLPFGAAVQIEMIVRMM